MTSPSAISTARSMLFDDISHRRVTQSLPDDVPPVYQPFSAATIRKAVRKLLAG